MITSALEMYSDASSNPSDAYSLVNHSTWRAHLAVTLQTTQNIDGDATTIVALVSNVRTAMLLGANLCLNRYEQSG